MNQFFIKNTINILVKIFREFHTRNIFERFENLLRTFHVNVLWKVPFGYENRSRYYRETTK